MLWLLVYIAMLTCHFGSVSIESAEPIAEFASAVQLARNDQSSPKDLAQCALRLNHLGRYHDAGIVGLAAINESLLQKDEQLLASLFSLQGMLETDRHDFGRAVVYFRASLASMSSGVEVTDEVGKSRITLNLSHALIRLGKIPQARAVLATVGNERVLDPELQIVKSLLLARIHIIDMEYDRAIEHLDSALKMAVGFQGSERLAAAIFAARSDAHLQRGDKRNAEADLHSAIDICRRSEGIENIHFIEYVLKLVNIFDSKGETDAALRLLNTLPHNLDEMLGVDHPLARDVRSHNNLIKSNQHGTR